MYGVSGVGRVGAISMENWWKAGGGGVEVKGGTTYRIEETWAEAICDIFIIAQRYLTATSCLPVPSIGR